MLAVNAKLNLSSNDRAFTTAFLNCSMSVDRGKGQIPHFYGTDNSQVPRVCQWGEGMLKFRLIDAKENDKCIQKNFSFVFLHLDDGTMTYMPILYKTANKATFSSLLVSLNFKQKNSRVGCRS